MTSNARILRERLQEKSQDKDNPFAEWKPHHTEYAKRGEKHICLCSHAPITELCFMENIHSKEIIKVGNCCVNKFWGIDLSAEFKALKKKAEEERRQEKIQRMMLVSNDYEKGFLESVMKKKNLSDKQKAIYDKIKKREEIDTILDGLKIFNTYSYPNGSIFDDKKFITDIRGNLSKGWKISPAQVKSLKRILIQNGVKCDNIAYDETKRMLNGEYKLSSSEVV